MTATRPTQRLPPAEDPPVDPDDPPVDGGGGDGGTDGDGSLSTRSRASPVRGTAAAAREEARRTTLNLRMRVRIRTSRSSRRRIATPTALRPTRTRPSPIADFGAAPIGVPNFVIDQFTIPPFLLPIYQACGTQYGIPWQVLASINRIETAFGTNLNVSSAGALGWMQFIPSSWEAYGVDANNDGRKDPYNPVDAICAAARYLEGRRRRGRPAPRDLRLQPRRLVRRRGPALRPASTASSPMTSSARSPA